MRDPARIDQLLAKLSEAWKLSPNLRFGQLINYLYEHCERNPVAMEDDEWENFIQMYINQKTIALFPLTPFGEKQDAESSIVALALDDFLEKFSKRPHQGFLAAFHVNGMEQINNVLGVRRGDQVMRDMAMTLSALLQSGDFMGRMPGAEYIVFFNTQDEALLNERLKILCRVLTQPLEQDITVTVSIGLVPVAPDENSFEELYKNIQIALHSIYSHEESEYAVYRAEMLQKQSDALFMLPDRAGDDCRVFIRTFGAFDVFVDGHPISFCGAQAKELLELLVNRKGGYLNSSEAISYLWEDEPSSKLVLTRLRKVALRLKRSLEDVGISDIIEYQGGLRRIVPERVRCDYYEYLRQEEKSSFPRHYMSGYSWSEETLASMISETE